MSEQSDVEQRIAQLEAAVKTLETCNQGNVTAIMRMKSQGSAVYSLLAEVTERHGFPAEVISAHYRVRSEFYLDRMLAEAENASPQLGAVLDDRSVEEVPEFDGYPPLFAADELDDSSDETGH